jgi:hypothetical protein
VKTPERTEVVVSGSDGQRTVCDPLPGETPKAFAAFVCFLSLGEGRTIDKVAGKLSRSSALIARWSRRFGWQSRLLAWNQRILEVQREKTEILALEGAADWAKRQRELRNREWEIVQKGLELVRRMIDKMLAKKRGKVSLQETSRLLEICSKVGRLSTGLATEREEVTGSGGGPIQVELSAALQKVYGTPSAVITLPDDKNASEGQLGPKESILESSPTTRNFPSDDHPENFPDPGVTPG